MTAKLSFAKAGVVQPIVPSQVVKVIKAFKHAVNQTPGGDKQCRGEAWTDVWT